MNAYLTDLKKLGARIRQKREELGIPPAVLAQKAGVGRGTLWILERGENPKTGKPARPGKEIVEKLALALRMEQHERNELLELAGYEVPWHFPTPQDKDYKQMMEALEKEIQRIDPAEVERAVASLPEDPELLLEHFRQEQLKAIETLLEFTQRFQSILRSLRYTHNGHPTALPDTDAKESITTNQGTSE